MAKKYNNEPDMQIREIEDRLVKVALKKSGLVKNGHVRPLMKSRNYRFK
jgi:hypothetical protein